jgi:hypothetical protein
LLRGLLEPVDLRGDRRIAAGTLPRPVPARGAGVGAAQINAVKAKCQTMGCSAVSVTITPEGEQRHGLTRFYQRFGFAGSGRSIVTHLLD